MEGKKGANEGIKRMNSLFDYNDHFYQIVDFCEEHSIILPHQHKLIPIELINPLREKLKRSLFTTISSKRLHQKRIGHVTARRYNELPALITSNNTTPPTSPLSKRIDPDYTRFFPTVPTNREIFDFLCKVQNSFKYLPLPPTPKKSSPLDDMTDEALVHKFQMMLKQRNHVLFPEKFPKDVPSDSSANHDDNKSQTEIPEKVDFEILQKQESRKISTDPQKSNSWKGRLRDRGTTATTKEIPAVKEQQPKATKKEKKVKKRSISEENPVQIMRSNIFTSTTELRWTSNSMEMNASFTIEDENLSSIEEKKLTTALKSMNTRIEAFAIDGHDFKSLLHKTWLTDNIVNPFILVQMNIAKSKGYKVMLFDSLLTSTLFGRGLSAGFRKRLVKNKVSSAHYWFLPINKNENHWTLMIIDLRGSRIIYLDSKHKKLEQKKITQTLSLIEEFYLSKVQNRPVNDWMVYSPTTIPYQHDDHNCGVHVCLWALIICQKLPMNFVAGEVYRARLNIAKILLETELKDEEGTRLRESTHGRLLEQSPPSNKGKPACKDKIPRVLQHLRDFEGNPSPFDYFAGFLEL